MCSLSLITARCARLPSTSGGLPAHHITGDEDCCPCASGERSLRRRRSEPCHKSTPKKTQSSKVQAGACTLCISSTASHVQHEGAGGREPPNNVWKRSEWRCLCHLVVAAGSSPNHMRFHIYKKRNLLRPSSARAFQGGRTQRNLNHLSSARPTQSTLRNTSGHPN